MTEPRDPDRLIRAFLAEGQTELPDRAYDAVRGHIDRERQRVMIGPWRAPHLSNIAGIAIAAAAVLVVAVVGINLVPSSNVGGVGGRITPSPAPSPSPTTEHVSARTAVAVATCVGFDDVGVARIVQPSRAVDPADRVRAGAVA